MWARALSAVQPSTQLQGLQVVYKLCCSTRTAAAGLPKRDGSVSRGG